MLVETWAEPDPVTINTELYNNMSKVMSMTGSLKTGLAKQLESRGEADVKFEAFCLQTKSGFFCFLLALNAQRRIIPASVDIFGISLALSVSDKQELEPV